MNTLLDWSFTEHLHCPLSKKQNKTKKVPTYDCKSRSLSQAMEAENSSVDVPSLCWSSSPKPHLSGQVSEPKQEHLLLFLAL